LLPQRSHFGGSFVLSKTTYRAGGFIMAYKVSIGRGAQGDIVYGDDLDQDTKIDFEEDVIKLVANGTEYVTVGTGSINVNLAGTVGVDEYIYHNGDDDTFMRFEDDSITFQAGNQELLTLTEAAQDEVVINENNNDVDFRVESSYATHMFYIDGANHRIGVGTNSPQSVLHIVDPLDGTGAERDAVIIMKSKKETGIKLIADSSNDNSGGEENNPFVDFYQDGQTDASGRGQRNASIAMEGPAATTFTGSLANAFFMDAHVPNSPHSNRPLQLASDSTNGGHAARITLEGTNGHVGIHTSTPSTEMEVIGTTKSDFFATDVTEQDLGSGTSSTLSTASGIVLLDADSINGIDMGIGTEVHTLAFPTPSVSGQKLTIIAKNANTNNTMILPSGLISGSFSQLHDSSGISVLSFVWVTVGTGATAHAAWYQV
jgi:hypothetical protein